MYDLANAKITQFTETRSAGRPVNMHVVQRRSVVQPDFEKMRKLVHDGPANQSEQLSA